MISTIHLSEGLLTSYFVYLSVEETRMRLINIVNLIFLKNFDVFQEWYLVHAHCFYPINQRSYFQCLSAVLSCSLKPMISASNIHAVTVFLSVFSLVVKVSAFPWIPVTRQQYTFQASYFCISGKSPVISKTVRCYETSVGARNHCSVHK